MIGGPLLLFLGLPLPVGTVSIEGLKENLF
jgi:hypothetical protein